MGTIGMVMSFLFGIGAAMVFGTGAVILMYNIKKRHLRDIIEEDSKKYVDNQTNQLKEYMLSIYDKRIREILSIYNKDEIITKIEQIEQYMDVNREQTNMMDQQMHKYLKRLAYILTEYRPAAVDPMEIIEADYTEITAEQDNKGTITLFQDNSNAVVKSTRSIKIHEGEHFLLLYLMIIEMKEEYLIDAFHNLRTTYYEEEEKE